MNPGIFTSCSSHGEPRIIQPGLLAVTPSSWLPTPCGPPEACRSSHEAGDTEGSPGCLCCVEILKTLPVQNSGSAQPYIYRMYAHSGGSPGLASPARDPQASLAPASPGLSLRSLVAARWSRLQHTMPGWVAPLHPGAIKYTWCDLVTEPLLYSTQGQVSCHLSAEKPPGCPGMLSLWLSSPCGGDLLARGPGQVKGHTDPALRAVGPALISNHDSLSGAKRSL